MLLDLILKNRSYRRFDENGLIDREQLEGLVNLARLSPAARNAQALKFILSYTPETNQKIFPCLAWAGALKGWKGPAEGERPTAYIIIVNDQSIRKNFLCDHGIVAQSMLLGAVEQGFGGCMIGAINQPKLREVLQLPEQYEILLVLALGKPAEKVVIEPMPEDGNFNYWRDEQGVHHVPKRAVTDLLLNVDGLAESS